MMNVDPTKNMIVFRYRTWRKADTAIGEALTRTPNGVQKVWEQVSAEHSLKPRSVQEIYTEWEPSDEDKTFLDATFPGVKVSFSFERPASERGWEQAFETAKEAMLAAARKQNLPDAAHFPVLRDADGIAQELFVTRSLTPDLVLCLAQVGITPRGTIGIDYVMEKDAPDADTLWTQAYTTVMTGLAVNAAEDDGHPLLVINREQGLGAAAVALPDFAQRMEGMLNTPRLYVAIPEPNTLLAVAADSPIAEKIQQMALNSDYSGAVALTPCVLLYENGQPAVMGRRE
ncbi:MAG: hypothetical protein AAFU54_22475 [Chloroflexota bacterium]